MGLDDFINQAERLKNERPDSPLQELWESDCSRFLEKTYGQKVAEIFRNNTWPNKYATSDEEHHELRVEGLNNSIQFLKSLKGREASAEEIEEQTTVRIEKTKESVQRKIHNITVNGPATFGDNSSINQITTIEFINALTEEVRKLPESEDKRKLLKSLQSIIANPTFASVAGSSVGALISKLLGA